MKNNIIKVLLLVLPVFLLPMLPVDASDVTHANYVGTIQATNNNTSLITDVCANFTIGINQMIAAGQLNAGATNIVARSDTGSDIPIMPGYNGNSTILFYDSILGLTSRRAYIYSGNVTGNNPAYFPGSAGMTVNSSASMAITNNFQIDWSGYIDTSVSDNIVSKLGSFQLQSDSAGNIISKIYTTDNAITGNNTNPGGWSNPAFAYDGNLGTCASIAMAAGSDSGYLYLGTANFTSTTVSFYTAGTSYGTSTIIHPYIYYSGSWHALSTFGSHATTPQWDTVSTATSELITGVAMYAHNGAGGGETLQWYDWGFNGSTTVNSVIKQACSTGEHVISVLEDGSNYWISLDGSPGTYNTAVTAISNSNNWIICGTATPYMNYFREYVSSVLKCSITWQYAATFTDLSGNGNTAYPSFRTTCSYSNVTTALIAFEPVSQSVPDQATINTWPTMIPAVPDQPATMYTENSTPGIFFAPLIHSIWPDSVPESLFWYNFAFIIILLASVLVFYFFASKGQNALLLKVIVSTAVMIFFALPGPNIYGFYVVIYHIMWCFGIMVLSRSYGW